MLNIETVMSTAMSSAKTKEGRDRIAEVEFYSAYAEPGYDGDKIAVGNWNAISKWYKAGGESVDIDNTPERLGNLLEKMGYDLVWSDEWVACLHCNKLVRTTPDSYSWKASYNLIDYEPFCHECI